MYLHNGKDVDVKIIKVSEFRQDSTQQ